MKKRIGLVGFGCVGQGFYEIIENQDGSDLEIIKIAVKNKKARSAPNELFVYDIFEILNDTSVDVIVELIDDAQVAFKIAKHALNRGIPIISANKKMIAENLGELIKLQQKNDTPLLYEGAVCGAIPIIQSINDYFKYDEIQTVEGIFNGSSNYILSKIFNEKLSYEEALSEAQELGFAETDPTLDVGGFDPAFKLSIISKHAFDFAIEPSAILNIGIDQLTQSEFQFAQDNDLKIKLIAKAKKVKNAISFIVAPFFVQKSEELYSLENENNGVLVSTTYADKQLLIGKGAGSYPTGVAVFSDLKKLLTGYAYSYEELERKAGDTLVTAYIKHKGNAQELSAFENIHERYNGKDHNYIIGKISTQKLSELARLADVHIVLLSEKSTAHIVNQLTYSYA